MSVGTVTLRDPTDADFEPIFAMTQDPVANAMSMVYPLPREQFEQRWQSTSDDSSICKKIILCDGAVVGKVSTFTVEDETHVGYLIAQPHWGKGIMSKALCQFLELVEHRPLMAHVASSNAGSRRVLEKCGFVKVDERESPETERYMACVEAIYELR
ncbi:MAG: GNAT family N-acetyltransferase [Phycisphaerales bacterium]